MKISKSEGVALSRLEATSTGNGMNAALKAKSFSLSKQEVWEAYKRIKANRGGAGIDGQSIADFEENLSGNLYKIWNSMASGSYFPPPVRRVDIPKGNGQSRPLGIPTVADRIAQMVITLRLQPKLEAVFHEDSYGYRLGKSAKDALGKARQRCWRFNWVVDLDIKAFFETIDHELLMRAIRRHTDDAAVLLYITRWLKAPTQMADGSLVDRNCGTPQGGVISPLLANLYLHYAFDLWMLREHPSLPFERYADDIICHCFSEKQARYLVEVIASRFKKCHLELNPQKTTIAYCGAAAHQANFPQVSFDFLGYTFRPRKVKRSSGQIGLSFTPAISQKASKLIRQTIRAWRFQRRSDVSLQEIACKINPVLRGWINYYGSYTRSALYGLFQHLDFALIRWAMSKFKKLRRRQHQAHRWLCQAKRRQPTLFAHWYLLSSNK